MNKVKLLNIIKWFGLYIVLTASFYALGQFIFAPKPAEPQTPKLLIQVDDKKDWRLGSDNSALTLVEYCDYLNQACQEYYPVLKSLSDELGETLRIVYRHFPERENETARLAAMASEAAGQQGKFWQMHDLLFDKSEDWVTLDNPREIFVTYANKLELNTDKFEEDLDSEELGREVDGDLFGGLASGVESAPTFFLNGELIQLPANFDDAALLLKSSLDNGASPETGQ